MREIKFRAWDTYSKPNKMVQFKDGDFIAWHAPSNWKDCYILMQYTGLKDKNGKEIYEGDVFKKQHKLNQLLSGNYSNIGFVYYKVCYENSSFIGKQIDFDKTLVDYFSEGKIYHGLKENLKNVEIIGNIYENPELLNND